MICPDLRQECFCGNNLLDLQEWWWCRQQAEKKSMVKEPTANQELTAAVRDALNKLIDTLKIGHKDGLIISYDHDHLLGGAYDPARA